LNRLRYISLLKKRREKNYGVKKDGRTIWR
jgi:hypothetical protein